MRGRGSVLRLARFSGARMAEALAFGKVAYKSKFKQF
jgi:hypothetical protein